MFMEKCNETHVLLSDSPEALKPINQDHGIFDQFQASLFWLYALYLRTQQDWTPTE